MARKNRVSVYDGVYHITSRIANRAMLFEPEEIKDRIVEWIGSVAEFSGVEVWSWCIMDNHLHLLVHVPPVPTRYWVDPNDEPVAYAFGARPPECRVPRWSPEGDCPPRAKPPVGFMLADDEMLCRLRCLYGPKRADEVGSLWRSLRERGLDNAVDEAKERYCRRMYNVSQFVKTLKERISMWYNAEYGHVGCLWQGRFHSGVVEKSAVVLAVVSAYIGYNPVKAHIAPSPEMWRWSSYALAAKDQGAEGLRCRQMYERMLGRPWKKVRATLESIYADGLPDDVTPETLRERFDDFDEEMVENGRNSEENRLESGQRARFRASQAIRATMWFFSHGAYVGRDMEFLERVYGALPLRFPCAGAKSIRRCRAFSWELPQRDSELEAA